MDLLYMRLKKNPIRKVIKIFNDSCSAVLDSGDSMKMKKLEYSKNYAVIQKTVEPADHTVHDFQDGAP